MLNRRKLVNEIRKITDFSYSDFEDFPKTRNEAFERWGEAFRIYGKDISPNSLSAEMAKDSMIDYMTNESAAGGYYGIGVMEKAIYQFALVLGTGMAPTFTGTPAPNTLNFNDIYSSGFGGTSAEEIAERLATRIHNWFVTGTAINNSSGATINWS